MKKKIIKAIGITSAAVMLCALTACGQGRNKAKNIINGNYSKTVDGSGIMSKSDFQIPDGQNYKLIVSGLSSSDSSIKVSIASSGNNAVIETDDNVISDFNLSINEQAGTITFSADEKILYNRINCTISVNAAVNAVEADGAAVIEYNAPENTDNVEIKLNGACSMTAAGTAERAVYELSGASELKAYGLSANEVTVDASGASAAEVCANSVLNAEASGTSSIKYSGDPDTVNDSVSGVSSVRKSG